MIKFHAKTSSLGKLLRCFVIASFICSVGSIASCRGVENVEDIKDIEKFSEGDIKATLSIVKILTEGKKYAREDGGEFKIFKMSKPRDFLEMIIAKRFKKSPLDVIPLVELAKLPNKYYIFEFNAEQALSESDRIKLTLRTFAEKFNVAINIEPYEQEGYFLSVADAKLVASTQLPSHNDKFELPFQEYQESLPIPCTMKNLAGYMQRHMDALVLDRTKLTNTYNISIRMTGDGPVELESINEIMGKEGLKLEPFKEKQKVVSIVIREKK